MQRIKIPRFAWLLVCLAPGAFHSLAAGPPMAVLVERKPFPARLESIDAAWQLTFISEKEQRTALSASELVLWGRCSTIGRGSLFVLADGGLLAAEPLKIDHEKVVAESSLFGKIEVPLERLRGVVFATSTRQRRKAIFEQLGKITDNSDRLILTNGDKLLGTIIGLQNDRVRLQTETGPIEVGMHRIVAWAFNPNLLQQVNHQGIHAWVGLADGSRLIASRIILHKKMLTLSTAWKTAWTTLADDLVFLQPLGGRAVYLSDLKPAAYRHIPYLNLKWPYQADRRLLGGNLHCGGKTVLKGLAMHSASRLTYLLEKPYTRFQAEIGIDDSTEGLGSVHFRVYVDRKKRFESPVVRGGMPPVPISVDLIGAKRLDLLVDFADHADEQDHAEWLNARFIARKK